MVQGSLESNDLLLGPTHGCWEGDHQLGNVSSAVISEEVGHYLNSKDEKGFFTYVSLPLFFPSEKLVS